MTHNPRQADIAPVPADWGLPSWTPEHFKTFNDARRKVHEAMQRWDEVLPGQSTIGRKA